MGKITDESVDIDKKLIKKTIYNYLYFLYIGQKSNPNKNENLEKWSSSNYWHLPPVLPEANPQAALNHLLGTKTYQVGLISHAKMALVIRKNVQSAAQKTTCLLFLK